MNYSKKQIQPLIDKFKINAETNKVFQSIIEMFDGQTNYQIWGIKAVFGRFINLDDLKSIQSWAENNQTMIKDLIKHNIVSYTSESDLQNLKLEIVGLNMISAVKNSINKFNTDQREILRSVIFKKEMNGLEAANASSFIKWFDIFKKFEMLSEERKKNLIVTSSALRDTTALTQAIKDALTEKYEWNKLDLLRFIECNTKDTKIVFDKDNVVVANIGCFADSKKLCGDGRTQWCLTREDKFFRQYVTEPKDNKQFFLFNFGLPEKDELAHIGFTVNTPRGIVNAHSTSNHCMLNDGIRYKNKNINIQNALGMSGVPVSVFMPLKKNKNFKWDVDSFLEFVNKNNDLIALVSSKENKVIVRLMNNNVIQKITEHCYIDGSRFNASNGTKVYAILNFNEPENGDNSMILLYYVQDQYKFDTLNIILNQYGANITKDGCLEKMGITSDMFLNREKIDSKIMLHKLIDEGNESEACALLTKEWDDIDINYEFNQSIPIFKVVNSNMFKLFKLMVEHPKFNYAVCDGFGEPILQSLLYAYGMNGADSTKNVKKMIDIILECDKFDFNCQNINEDTAINVAAEREELNWVVEKLLTKPNIDINVINDYNCTSLGNAIRRKNVNAVKMLLAQPNVLIREEDYELAKQANIKLDELKPKDRKEEYKAVYASVFK